MATKLSDKPLQHEVSWPEVARIAFEAKGISEGLWKIGVKLNFAGANAGPEGGEVLPAAVVGVRAVVLTATKEPGPLVFDAGELSKAVATNAPARRRTKGGGGTVRR